MFDSTMEYQNAQWDSKILGIREVSERRYKVKLEIEQNGFTCNLMNLIVTFDALDRPYFIDTFSENIQQFNISERKNTTFYYSPKTTKNERLE